MEWPDEMKIEFFQLTEKTGRKLSGMIEEMLIKDPSIKRDVRSVIRLAVATLSNYQENFEHYHTVFWAGYPNNRLFTKKCWVSIRDKKVCEICADMDGVEVGIDEKFKLSNGDELMFPGDINAKFAESIVGCRCIAMYSK